jgi:hypothetical protein
MRLAKYLGRDVSEMLGREPFKNWLVERSTEEDLDELAIHYVFDGHGLELRCDRDERVCTIFLHSEEYGGFREASVLDIPFSSTRQEILELLGPPAKTGSGIHDPGLGDYGPWDRFAQPGFAVHVEYRVDADRVKTITLIRAGVFPCDAGAEAAEM